MSKSSLLLKESWIERESLLRGKGFHVIAGVDEAGRGPLAGPVAAAAVILPPGCMIEGLNDSKKLSPARREALAVEIKRQAVAWGIGIVSSRVIDRIGIVPSTFRAMSLAIGRLGGRPDYLIVDGNQKVPGYEGAQEALIDGDALAAPVAAASILAKVVRDGLMERYARFFPGYGFEQHKGYGTQAHRSAILEQGTCLLHRATFVHLHRPEGG
ncbi:ribonuclease HII [Heliomicrobium undosum]|uniref:ribonuclease HII n=1 Tax=Heliomicrobium undosum TaxID=121734 RepID=UPI002E2E6382|nr:ribonuclease HII [Heliomicrobium undosum]